MSNAPTDLQQIATLLPQIKAARDALAEAETRVATLQMRNGQQCAGVSIMGLTVWLTAASERTSYYPERVQGRQALLDACLRAASDHVIECRSKLEGLQHKLRQLAKLQPQESAR